MNTKLPAERLKGKILYIEDDSIIIENYKHIFASEGFELFLAKTKYEALRLAEKEKPDLMIFDPIMVSMDGLDIIKIFKEQAETKDMPIIILTNMDPVFFAQEAKEMGASEFFVKAHTTPVELINKIKEILNI